MAPLRQEVRYHKVQETEIEDPEEVTVYLYRQSSRTIIQTQYRETSLRILSSVLLLAVAVAFVVYELEYWSLDKPAASQRPEGALKQSWNISLWAGEHKEKTGEGHPHEEPEGEGHPHEEPEGEGHPHEEPEGEGHPHEEPEGEGHPHEEPEGEGHPHEEPEGEGHPHEEPEGEGHPHEEPEGERHPHDEPDSSHHHTEESDLPTVNHKHNTGTYHESAIVTASETCSRIGRDVLASNGTVVDAAIAAILCLAVVHPHTISLGGIFSSIYYSAITNNASVLNAMPREPTPTRYGIPHMLQGLWMLYRKYGSKPWSQLVDSAVRLAKHGFLVDDKLAAALEANRETVMSSVGLCNLFCEANNTMKPAGVTVMNPQLGHILEEIVTSMTDSLLPSGLVQSLLHDIEETQRDAFSKAMSTKDLRIEDPLPFHAAGITLYSTPGPTAGKILSDSLQKTYKNSEFKNGDMASSMNKAYRILLNSAMDMYSKGGAKPRESPTTLSVQSKPTCSPAPVGTNVLVADTYGNMFVMSLSLNGTFGSGFVSPSTGILLSNFACGIESTHPMFWASPSVLLLGEDQDVLGLGATGGSSVPFSLAQVIINHQSLKKDLADSIHGPLVDLSNETSRPWYEYFGLLGSKEDHPSSVVSVEVQAEHVHVASSPGLCCFPSGL
ncbi:glutathione hydrolase 6-like [Pelodytes ibericus]